MLMMMRADEGYTPVEWCTAEELLACITADDYDACIAACSDEEEEENQDPEEVKAGTLNVTMKSAEGGEIVKNVSALPIATYTLKATDEDINISSLVVKEAWYTHAISNYALFIDGVRVSKLKTNTNLGKEVTINLTSSYTIKAGKSVDVELRWTTINWASDGYSVELVNVNSSAEKVKLPSNVKSNTFKNLTSTATTTIAVAATPTQSIKVGSNGASLFEFTLANNDTTKKDVEFNTITFIANDKDVAEYFSNFELVAEGSVIATTKDMDGKYLTFKLNSAYEIEEWDTAEFTVKADVKGWADATTAPYFYVETVMDVEANVPTYNAPINLDNTALDGTVGNRVTVTVDAWRVTITRTNPVSTSFAKNTNNLYLWSFTINNNENSDLTLEKFTMTITDKDTTAYTPTELKDYILADGFKVRYGSTTAGLNELVCTYSTTAHAYTCHSDTDVVINSKLNVYLYADIENNAATTWLDTEKFQVELLNGTTNLAIREWKTDTLVSDISLQSKFTLMEGKSSTLNVTKVNLPEKTYAYGTEDIDIVSFKIKTSDNWVKVKSLAFVQNTPTTALDRNTIANARVFVDDEEYSATLNTDKTITMKTPFTLDANTTTTITLQIDLWNNPVAFKYDLQKIDAVDTTSDKNDVSYTTPVIEWRNVKVNDGATLTFSFENTENNASDKSILAGTTWVIAEYGLKANYEAVNVKEMTVVFSEDVDELENVELSLDGEVVASNPEWSTDWKTATFKNLSFNVDTTKSILAVSIDTTAYNADSITPLQNVKVNSINITKASWKTSWNDITKSCTEVSKVFDVVPATVTVSVTSSTNTETKLNLFVDKWNNTNASDDAVKVYILDTVAHLVSEGANGTIKSYTLTLNNKLVWIYTTATSSWGSFPSNINDLELKAWNNTLTVSYTVDTTVAPNNPSYNVDLLRVEYTVDTMLTSAELSSVTNLLATTKRLSNRMDRLDLVDR